MSEALVQLAERCEAATGPNFELEREIADAVWRAKWGKRRPKDISPQPCTASLDAAITLVPPEHAVDLTAGKDRHPTSPTPAQRAPARGRLDPALTGRGWQNPAK